MAETLRAVTIDQISDKELTPHITSSMVLSPWVLWMYLFLHGWNLLQPCCHHSA